MRKNGIFDQINASYADKGLYYYARTGEGVQYYLYSNKKIDKADLTGLKLRVAPIYRDFLQKQNATVVQMAPGEVYTALERGVVDGYGWPMIGIFDLGWHEKTKYRLEPGFYAIELGVVFNLASWNKLNAQQKAFLTEAGRMAGGAERRDGQGRRPGRCQEAARRRHPGDQARRGAIEDPAQGGLRRRLGADHQGQPGQGAEAARADGAEVGR